jgi:hypothetical protein
MVFSSLLTLTFGEFRRRHGIDYRHIQQSDEHSVSRMDCAACLWPVYVEGGRMWTGSLLRPRQRVQHGRDERQAGLKWDRLIAGGEAVRLGRPSCVAPSP